MQRGSQQPEGMDDTKGSNGDGPYQACILTRWLTAGLDEVGPAEPPHPSPPELRGWDRGMDLVTSGREVREGSDSGWG